MTMQREQQNKVSIIVPVYNAEQWIGYCLNSIVSQTYRNIEVIVINDGSTDASLAICENYGRIDKRVHVFDIPNGGVGRARNTGIKYATGEYIQFVDSDDVISFEMVEKLVKAIETYHADIAFCGMDVVKLDDQKNAKVVDVFSSGMIGKECVLSEKEFNEKFPYLILHTVMLEGPCNRIYKTNILKENNIIFPEKWSLGEDMIFNFDYYSYCRKFVLLSEPYYYYLQHNVLSLTKRYQADMLENRLELLNRYAQYMDQKKAWTEGGEKYYSSYAIGYMISVLKNIFVCKGNTEAEKKAEIEEVLNCELFKENIVKAGWIDEQWEWLRECMQYTDVGTVYEKGMSLSRLSEQEVLKEEHLKPNPGKVNLIMVRSIERLNHVLHSRRLAKVRRSLINDGIKITMHRIFGKGK